MPSEIMNMASVAFKPDESKVLDLDIKVSQRSKNEVPQSNFEGFVKDDTDEEDLQK